MTAFKTIATLILVSIIGLALMNGPLTDIGGKETPGQQSPPESGVLDGGPPPLVVLLAFGVAVLAGLKARSVVNEYG